MSGYRIRGEVWKYWKIGAVLILVGLILFAPRPWAPRPARLAFRKVICSPVPPSVKNLQFGNSQLIENDLVSIREYFAFSVASNDLRRIVTAKAFQAVEKHAVVTNGPPWFRVESIGTNGKCFVFSRGKRKDFLWVDDTGTNCFYLYELVD